MMSQDSKHRTLESEIVDELKRYASIMLAISNGESPGPLEENGSTSNLKPLREAFNRLLDMHEQRSEEILRLQDELTYMRLIAEENPNPVLQFSIRTKSISYLNSTGKKLLSSLGKRELAIITSSWLDSIEESVRTQTAFSRELHNERENVIHMCTVVPSEDNVNIYATDVTAIKLAEREIRRLSFAIDKSNNAVLIADRTGMIQWVNKGFERVTGYALSDVINTRGEILRKGKHTGLSDDSPFYKKVLESGQSVSYESRNYRKDGTDYWTLSTLTPLLNDDQELVSIIAVDSDITEKKKNEQELYEAKIQAEKSSKAKELFLANMSHEIRTPMNAIMGIIQLLKETELNGEQREYLRSINFASENLLRIINDVLDISKIESGKMSIEKVPYNLKELLTDLVNSIEHRATEKNIELEVRIDSKVPKTIIGDPVRLNQVILNLISNAIKFTEKGHVILYVEVDRFEDDAVFMEFRIEDTGIGIPEDMLDHIFGAFEQVQRSDKAKYGGTGLGLSIVKRIVDLHGGSIEVTSKEGKGTVFKCIIPSAYRQADSQQNVQGASYYSSELLSGKRALLVEDNTLNQLVAKKFLGAFGLTVEIAGDGLEAIAKIKNATYDLILMDIQMPNMDGYETSRTIRNDMGLTTVPIIAMTAHAIQGEEQRCLDAGMSAYISKPIKKGVLFEKLKSLFNEPNAIS